MPRKAKSKKPVEATPVDQPEIAIKNWTTTEEYQHNGRWMRPGTEISIEGIRGRCRFVRHVVNNDTGAEWIDCFDIHKHYRAFQPKRIKTVHHTTRTRENAHA